MGGKRTISMKQQALIVAVAVLISACSGAADGNSAPTQEDGEAEFLASDLYKREFDEGIVRLRRFTKANGQMGEVFGVDVYTMYYEAEIEYLVDDPKLKDIFGGYTDNSLNKVLLRCRQDADKQGPRCRDRRSGEIVNISGDLLFEMTENGWIGDSGFVVGTIPKAGRSTKPASGSERESSDSRDDYPPQSGSSTYADQLLGHWLSDEMQMKLSVAQDRTAAIAFRGQYEIIGTIQQTGSNSVEILSADADGSSNRNLSFSYTISDDLLSMRVDGDVIVLRKTNEPVADGLGYLEEERRTYLISIQVSEGLNLAGGAKAAVTEFFLDRGRFPSSNPEAGMDEAVRIQGKYVQSVQIQSSGGVIKVTFEGQSDPAISGSSIYLVPEARSGSVSWRCFSESANKPFVPPACSEIVPTTISTGVARESVSQRSDNLPSLLVSPDPTYPSRARSLGLEGSVQVQFSIHASGTPKDVVVVSSTSTLFERSAVQSILDRRYEPPGYAVSNVRETAAFTLD